MRLVATGRAKISDIVAVTFTEKAAGELKLRIRTELEKARGEIALRGPMPSDRSSHPASSVLLDEALARLEEAHVSTIHGFCADLLRERPVEAGVDPGFEVLTEPGAERLFDRAFREWFQQGLRIRPRVSAARYDGCHPRGHRMRRRRMAPWRASARPLLTCANGETCERPGVATRSIAMRPSHAVSPSSVRLRTSR